MGHFRSFFACFCSGIGRTSPRSIEFSTGLLLVLIQVIESNVLHAFLLLELDWLGWNWSIGTTLCDNTGLLPAADRVADSFWRWTPWPRATEWIIRVSQWDVNFSIIQVGWMTFQWHWKLENWLFGGLLWLFGGGIGISLLPCLLSWNFEWIISSNLTYVYSTSQQA